MNAPKTPLDSQSRTRINGEKFIFSAGQAALSLSLCIRGVTEDVPGSAVNSLMDLMGSIPPQGEAEERWHPALPAHLPQTKLHL